MKIKSVDIWIEKITLKRPYKIAFKEFDEVENIFVKLTLEDSKVGLGVAAPEKSITGESYQDAMSNLNNYVVEGLIGKDINTFQGIINELSLKMVKTPAALSAVDGALHDLFTQTIGTPLVDFLGRKHHKLPTSITVGIKSPLESVEEAREYIKRGFKVLKIKIGKSLEEDLAVLRRLRESLPSDIVIRVDANKGYERDSFLKFIDAMETYKLNLEFIEQPFHESKNHLMTTLPYKVNKICAADESLHTDRDAIKLDAYFRIYNIKLMKCGGISNALKIAHVAELLGIDLMWGCMDESIVSISTALHAAFASKSTKYLDLDGSLDLSKDLVDGGFIIEDGFMRTTDRPGLGVGLI